jgi:hypothetical protein
VNISEFKVKPKLIEIVLDDKSIIDAYKEEITFYMYDHIAIPKYFDFFKAQSEGNTNKLLELMRELILDVNGKAVMDNDHTLPIDIFTACVLKVTDHLGKSVTKHSTQTETGTQQ